VVSNSFNIRDYGAKGDGTTLDTGAINKAIEVCSAAGGGTVYFPAGEGEHRGIVGRGNGIK
jgi:polygalacturonase